MDNMSAYNDGFQAGYDGVLNADLSAYEGTHLNAFYNGYQDGTDAYLLDSDASDFGPEDGRDEDGLTPVEADAMTLRDVGWGTDEDYGYYNDDFGSYFGGEDYYG